jgi:hypothetical protein
MAIRSADTLMRLAPVLAFLVVCLAAPWFSGAAGVRLSGAGLAHAQAAAAGEVSFVAGIVQASAGGPARDLKVGDVVSQGDALVTGATGHLHIRTVDKGFLALRPNSRARIELYEFAPGNPAGTRIRLTLDAGVMRSVSGEGAQAARQNFRLNTPVAAIGIRGTDFSVSTTDALTRAVVRSGAIVVAAFDGDCRVDALGPCRGDTARLLSGDQIGKLLELRRGQAEPALLDIRNGSGAPDQVAPPVPAEPRSSIPADKAVPLGQQAAAVSTEGRLGAVLSAARPPEPVVIPPPVVPPVIVEPPPVVVIPPVVPPPVVVVPPVVVEPPVATVNWGRWQPLAGAPAGVSPDDFVAQYGPLIAINRLYLLAGAGTENLRMPASGEYSFRLDRAEAYLTNTSGAPALPAQVQSGTLAVDFGRARFTTGLNVAVQSSLYELRAQGRITSDGRFASNIIYTDGVTNTAVQGALAGAQGERAAYLFDYAIDPRRAIIGAAGWQR